MVAANQITQSGQQSVLEAVGTTKDDCGIDGIEEVVTTLSWIL